ncbi:ABC transporter permease [Rhizobium leguminosarum bv. viciae]|uniref:ABC transporter permease n=1 Tax=Rhizobium leguminosarum TaxID=384 RepID=UPI00144150B1|nr:ABC transporter permease [Rhizobium leguminosarum]NKJ94712.1 ABC transporter permease [Rhizobium leguminosarum bv. viciae]NKK87474.1 ABC transporter permease [Rhizobium leguminosarum bv. viciae]
MTSRALPGWISYGIIPALNLSLAALATGLAIWMIGEDPIQALSLLVIGAIGDGEMVPHGYALGYTLFYATNFIFTGLAFAVAMRAGQFNIGAEGQLAAGGIALAAVTVSAGSLSAFLLIPLAILASAAGAALWVAIPAIMYVKRQSHVVITTIMMNFIASALSVYLIVRHFAQAGTGATESVAFPAQSNLFSLASILSGIGVSVDETPGNVTFVMALVVAGLIWVLLYRSRFGYKLRTAGANPAAASYAGIDLSRITMIALLISGALAGLVAVNELLGFSHKLTLGFAAGFGFGGIAVAMMGRLHPAGIIIGAIFFGGLVQGGAELSYQMPGIRREMVVAIQGFVIYFTTATELIFADHITRFWIRFANWRNRTSAVGGQS